MSLLAIMMGGRCNVVPALFARQGKADVVHRLPTETTVVHTAGCYASISVGEAVLKADANATSQAFVLKKFGSLLSCLP